MKLIKEMRNLKIRLEIILGSINLAEVIRRRLVYHKDNKILIKDLIHFLLLEVVIHMYIT